MEGSKVFVISFCRPGIWLAPHHRAVRGKGKDGANNETAALIRACPIDRFPSATTQLPCEASRETFVAVYYRTTEISSILPPLCLTRCLTGCWIVVVIKKKQEEEDTTKLKSMWRRGEGKGTLV
jgi:hypothetical protein